MSRLLTRSALAITALAVFGWSTPSAHAGGGGNGRGVRPDRSAVCPKVIGIDTYSTGAVLHVYTKALSTLTVQYSAQVGGGGSISKNGNTTSLVETKPAIATRDFTIPAGFLFENTGYNYAVTARQANGRTCTSKGTFRTQTRSATMHLTFVSVLNDSDQFGNGELTFDGLLDTQWFCAMGGSMYNLDLGDGDSIGTDVWIAQNDVPSTFEAAISVHDDDVDPVTIIDQGTCGMAGDGSNANFDWSTAYAQIVSTPCLCGSQTFALMLSTPGVPWVDMEVVVTVGWP